MRKNTSRRLALPALLGAAAIAIGSSAFLSGPAFAAPGEGGEGTLTIHKLEQPDGPLGPNDGSEIEVGTAKPLVAGFTACTIDDIDLTIAADWERLRDIVLTLDGAGEPVATEDGTPLALTCGTEQMTAEADGTTQFTLPADKAYVVYESTVAANAIPAAAPSLITIPFPGNGEPGQPAWNYEPHIYPKNTLAGGGATKDGEIIGDQVSFDIMVPIPPLGAGETYQELRINDQLESFLQYTAGTVTLEDADGNPVTLTAGTDYTLTAPSGSGGDEVVLNFLPSGLAKLDANTGGKLHLRIDATATGSGSTANEAQITINGTSTDPGTGPSVVDPEEFFTGAHIVKEAKNKGASTNVPLAGATFDVYTAAAGATDCPATPDPTAAKVVDGAESAADGNTPNQVLAAGKYCVYETSAPAGYKPLQGGMLLDVTGENASVTVVNTQVGADEGDLPELPITGALGNVMLVAGGAALLLIAGTLVAARRRQQQRQ
ncbi:SpaH/EbpB family LPXTG-anchored major pilin [Leucobacter sp. NPDC015123]|uniref:SpaH/EbpB family LPXTG-anchored major pilin n=1 Tax=Leucobacter sp. NPDC015123 TaxID=3364129 RepID=UPI0036F4618A